MMEKEIVVETKIKVDEGFVDMLLNYADWFSRAYCGYWAFGIVKKKGNGWLFVECDEDGYCSDELKAKFDEAEKLWSSIRNTSGVHISPPFFAMDKNTVLDVIREGVKRYGPNFQEEYDDERLDVAIQMAFLKEVRYG